MDLNATDCQRSDYKVVLDRITTGCDETPCMTNGNLQRKGLFGWHVKVIVLGGRPRQQLKQDWNLEGGAGAEAMEGGWLPPHGPASPPPYLFCFLFKNIPYRLVYSLMLWRHLVSWGSLCTDDGSLCHDDRLASTVVFLSPAFWSRPVAAVSHCTQCALFQQIDQTECCSLGFRTPASCGSLCQHCPVTVPGWPWSLGDAYTSASSRR